MTIIAYKDGIMSCDSLISYNGSRHGICKKITRLEDGTLIGFAGDVDCRSGLALIEKRLLAGKYPSREELSEIDTDASFLIACTTGEVYVCSTGKNGEFLEWGYKGISAIGSGIDMAIGAMEAGATATQACEIVCDRVEGCGLPVFSEQLIVPKKRKKK